MGDYFEEIFTKHKEKYQNPTIQYMRSIDIDLIKSYSKKNYKILDIGFGEGWHIEQLTKQGFVVHGLEISKTLVERLSSRLKNVKLFLGSIDSKDLRIEEKYDLVYSFFCVLNLVHDLRQALRNINSLLRDNGYFIFSIENKHSIFAINKAIKSNPNRINFYKTRVVKYEILGKSFNLELRLYGKKELKKLLKNYGFEVEKIGGIFLIVRPCFSIIHDLKVDKELMRTEKEHMWEFPFNTFGEIQYFVCKKVRDLGTQCSKGFQIKL